MKTERTFEFKFADTVALSEHLVLLCRMLEAAELAEKEIVLNDLTENPEADAA